jgi:hypothetical protein
MIHANNYTPTTPTLFFINFSLAQLFHNPATYLHMPFTINHSIIGTIPFASINSQQGNSQSHHDDLESLMYTIIFSALGELPWTNNSTGNNEEAILCKKISIPAEELCKGLPAPFCEFITYVHSLTSLGFKEKLNYQYLYSILLWCLQTMTGQPVEVLPLYMCHVSLCQCGWSQYAYLHWSDVSGYTLYELHITGTNQT